jgi:acyl carrier protein
MSETDAAPVASVVAEYLRRERPDVATKGLGPETLLVDEGMLDSLLLLQLVAFLEERYGININSDEIVPENFETLSKIEQLVRRRLSDRAA